MTLALLLGIGVLALIAGWLGWRRVAAGGGVLVVLLFLAVACGPLPRWMLVHLQRPYATHLAGEWADRNAIVLLGTGTTRVAAGMPWEPPLFADGRIARTAALYRACELAGRQCLVLVSGGDAQHHGVSEAAVYAAQLRLLGVSAGDLELESRSRSTWQNAQFSRPLLQAYAPEKLLLVTSGIHLRRSLLYFGHFGMRPVPVRADLLQAQLSWLPVAWNLAVCDIALHEYTGMARYAIYNAMGWNTAAIRAPLIPAESD